eukprot:m51a1_g3433 hypothetical protein (274) ;mRNA; r:628800-629925
MTSEEQLAEYYEQIREVDAALAADPSSEELQLIRANLAEVIKLAEDLRKVSKKDDPPPAAPSSSPPHAIASASAPDEPEPTSRLHTAAGAVREGQQCEAYQPKDHRWYNAVVKEVQDDGYVIAFNEREAPIKVAQEHVRAAAPYTAPVEEASTQRGRKRPAPELLPNEIPKSLRINPTDPPKVVSAKKKRIHMLKSQMRFKKMDEASKGKQDSWKSFLSKQKSGKESIFKTPEGASGKVGVTGSGKPMTQISGARDKWKFALAGSDGSSTSAH